MGAALHPRDAASEVFRGGDGLVHCASCHNLTEPVLSIHCKRDRSNLAYLDIRTWVDQASPYAIEIERQPNQTMSVHTAEIRVNQILGHDGRIFRRDAMSEQELPRELEGVVGSDVEQLAGIINDGHSLAPQNESESAEKTP
jgi:hypothetical protein